MIFWTGDSSSHDLYNLNEIDVRETISTLSDLLYSQFPTTPIIPVLGNHDFHPPNYQKFNESFTHHL
jgi:sphingomyelin phosphodiesterase acid-like 3